MQMSCPIPCSTTSITAETVPLPLCFTFIFLLNCCLCLFLRGCWQINTYWRTPLSKLLRLAGSCQKRKIQLDASLMWSSSTEFTVDLRIEPSLVVMCWWNWLELVCAQENAHVLGFCSCASYKGDASLFVHLLPSSQERGAASKWHGNSSVCLRPADAGGRGCTNDSSPEVLSDWLPSSSYTNIIIVLCQGDFRVSAGCDGSKDFVDLEFFYWL